MYELTGAEPMDVDLRKLAFEVRQQIQIPLHRQFGVMPSLHQNLSTSQRYCLLDLLIYLLKGDYISITVFLCTIKRAELAVHIADIGVVDITINDVVNDVILANVVCIAFRKLPSPVRQRSQFFQRQRIQP